MSQHPAFSEIDKLLSEIDELKHKNLSLLRTINRMSSYITHAEAHLAQACDFTEDFEKELAEAYKENS